MDPPTQIDVLYVQERTAQVNWFPPSADLNCVDRYEIKWQNSVDETDVDSVSVDLLEQSVTVGNACRNCGKIRR